MSWDHVIKRIKCPCGQGTIEKNTKSDDWGRYEEETPKIVCPVCDNKYSLRTISHTSPFPWKGGYTCHYLVDKSIELKLEYKREYPRINDYELAKKDFPHYLVVRYKLDWLLEAQKELNEKSSAASLKGYAFGIAKARKKDIGSAKINDVRNDVSEAIKNYNSFIVNKEQLDEQEELYRKAKKELEEKIQKYGILLDI